MTTVGKWVVMDLRQAMETLSTHQARKRGKHVICGVCRTWTEKDEYTLVPVWPCAAVRQAQEVVGAAYRETLPSNPPPEMPASVARALRVPTWERTRTGTTPTSPVPPVKKERKKMAIELEVEPDKNHHGTVNVHVTDSSENLYETVDMPADDARLLGLKLIRAADASERRGW